jgi:hypothetical protein
LFLLQSGRPFFILLVALGASNASGSNWPRHTTTGPNKGKVFSAIYEIDDEQHKICFAAAGKERPTAFSALPGSGHLLQVWKREMK